MLPNPNLFDQRWFNAHHIPQNPHISRPKSQGWLNKTMPTRFNMRQNTNSMPSVPEPSMSICFPNIHRIRNLNLWSESSREPPYLYTYIILKRIKSSLSVSNSTHAVIDMFNSDNPEELPANFGFINYSKIPWPLCWCLRIIYANVVGFRVSGERDRFCICWDNSWT